MGLYFPGRENFEGIIIMGDNLQFFANAANILQKASQYTNYCQENYDVEAKDENSIFGQYNQDFLNDIGLSREEYINLLKTDSIDQDNDGILDVDEAATLSQKIAKGAYEDQQATFGAAIAYVLGATTANGASMKELYNIDKELFDTGSRGAEGQKLLSRGQLKEGNSAQNVMRLGTEAAVMGGWDGTFTNKDYATYSGYSKDQLAEAVSKAFQNDGMLTPEEVNSDPMLRQMFRERNLQDNNNPQSYNQLGRDNQFNSLFYGYQQHLTETMPGATIITDDQAAKIQEKLGTGTNTLPPEIESILNGNTTSPVPSVLSTTGIPEEGIVNPETANPTGTLIPSNPVDSRLSSIDQTLTELKNQAQGTTLPTEVKTGDQTVNPANVNVSPVVVENNVNQSVTCPTTPEIPTKPAQKEFTDGVTELTAEDKAKAKAEAKQVQGGTDEVENFANGDIKTRQMVNPENTAGVRYVQRSQNFWETAGNLVGGLVDVAVGGPLSFTGWGRRACHDGMEKVMSVFTGTQHEVKLAMADGSVQTFSSGSRYDVQRHLDRATGEQTFFANATGSQDKPWWNPF